MPLAKYEFQTFNSNDSRTFHIGLVSIHKRSPEMSDLIGLGIDDRISWSEILIKKTRHSQYYMERFRLGDTVLCSVKGHLFLFCKLCLYLLGVRGHFTRWLHSDYHDLIIRGFHERGRVSVLRG